MSVRPHRPAPSSRDPPARSSRPAGRLARSAASTVGGGRRPGPRRRGRQPPGHGSAAGDRSSAWWRPTARASSPRSSPCAAPASPPCSSTARRPRPRPLRIVARPGRRGAAALPLRLAPGSGRLDVLTRPEPEDRSPASASPPCRSPDLGGRQAHLGLDRHAARHRHPGRGADRRRRRLTATMGIRPDDRLLTTIPLSHSYGLSSLADARPAARHACWCSPRPGRSTIPFVAVERTGATVFPTVPAYLDALLRLSEPPRRPPTLRLVLTAGAPLAAGHRRAASARRFGLPVHVFYGASECGGICYDREGDAGERGTVGAPVEGVRVVLEPSTTSRGRRRRHRRNPRRSPPATSRTPTRASPTAASWPATWRSGRTASWRSPRRVDDLVNIKGKKVNPREVEEVLVRPRRAWTRWWSWACRAPAARASVCAP